MKKFSDYLENFEGNVLILTHHNADLDAISSSLLLKEALQRKDINCDVGAAESISKRAKKVSKGVLINPRTKSYDLLIILDTPSTEQLEPIDIQNKDFILIDHHQPSNLKNKALFSYADPNIKSTSRLVCNLINEMSIKMTPRMAELAILGIAGDTGILKFADKKDFKLISDLLEKTGKEFYQIISIGQKEMDISERIARLKSAKRVEIFKIGDYIVGLSKVGSFEASAARSLLGLGADIAIVFVRGKNKLRISGRCKYGITKKMHLTNDIFSKIKKLVGGSVGGHDAAASANGKNTKNIDKIKKVILKEMEKSFKSKKKKIKV